MTSAVTRSYKVKRCLCAETVTVMKRAVILSGNLLGNQNWVMGTDRHQGLEIVVKEVYPSLLE